MNNNNNNNNTNMISMIMNNNNDIEVVCNCRDKCIRKIECPKCDYTCCALYDKCINCNLEFPSYRERENILYIEDVLNEQKNLLPLTLIYINKKKEANAKKEDIKNKLVVLKEETGVLMQKHDSINNNRKESRIQKEYIKNKLLDIKEKVGELILELKNTRVIDEYEIMEDLKCQRLCPVSECSGYLSSALKCYACDVYVCIDCGNVKESRLDDNHVCKEDDKKIIDLAKKDTTQCPGCFKYIYNTGRLLCSSRRAGGLQSSRPAGDEIFCAGCHTVFSLNTGRKLNVVSYNYHYYAFIKKKRGIKQCYDLPQWYQIMYKFSLFSTEINSMYYQKLLDIYNSVINNEERVTRNSDRLSEIHKATLYLKYRERVLDSSSGYTEENWKRDLNSDIKMVEKYKQMKMIYDLNKIIVVDIFCKILDSDSVNINLYMKEFENIRNYSNLQLAEIYKYYGTKVYTYNERYRLE